MEAFWNQVARAGEDDCWPWTGPQFGGRGDHRYGQFTDGRWTYYAHRFAYAVKGVGMEVLLYVEPFQ